MNRVLVLGAALASAVVLAPGASAGESGKESARITDVRGDANGTDPRQIGQPTPADQQTPVSIAALDILAAEISSRQIRIDLAGTDDRVGARLVVVLHTPRCANVRLEWRTDSPTAALTGCRGSHRAGLPAAHRVGNTVAFTLPAPLPRWMPAGTPVTRMDVQTTGYVELVLAASYPPGDHASGRVSWTL
ncbi:MAG TPA: hypothetical protein VNA30_03990 [Mycobacteriales bacterium]|nr:hypothetical protein [Mycobacteriales bacterium]